MQAECAVDREVEQFRLKRLGKEIVSAERNRSQRVCLIILSGQDNNLGVGRDLKNLLKEPETFGDGIRIRRQSQIHGDHGGLVTPEVRDRAFGVACGERFVLVKRPTQLFL